MSNMGDKVHDFLIMGGEDLGYYTGNLPKIEDLDRVLKDKIPVWEYRGISKYEYFN